MTFTVSITPRSEREALIKKRVDASQELGETIYNFRGDTFTPPVISLPIGVPVYRMENCRTFSAQQTEIAREGLPKEFFDKGQELTTAQQHQHEILAKLAKDVPDSITPIDQVLAKDGQREAILITHSGIVVNGNRRLSAMRELMHLKSGLIDSRFENVRCAVLPPDITRDEVDDIEADLQGRPNTELPYDWIGDAQMLRRQISKKRTSKQVADRLRRNKNDIDNIIQAFDEADLYLSEWLGKPGEYNFVKEGEQIFGDLPKAIAKKDANMQNASRAIAWSIYKNRNKISGRVYRLNPGFGKLAPKVLEILEERLDLPEIEDSVDDDDDFAIDIDDAGDDKDFSPIIDALKDETTIDETIGVLVGACETAIELENGQKSEEAALKTLSLVNSKVRGTDVSTAGARTLPAILKQIETIRTGLDKIEAAVEKRQNGSAAGEADVG